MMDKANSDPNPSPNNILDTDADLDNLAAVSGLDKADSKCNSSDVMEKKHL